MYSTAPAAGQAAPQSLERQQSTHPDSKITEHFWNKYKVEAPFQHFMPSVSEPYLWTAGGLGVGAVVALAARSINLVGDMGACVITGAGGLMGYAVKGLRVTSHNFHNLRPLVNAEYRASQLLEASAVADQGIQLAKGTELSKYMFAGRLTQLYYKDVQYSELSKANDEYESAFENAKTKRSNVTALFGGSHQASSDFIRTVAQGHIPVNTSERAVDAARASLEANQAVSDKKLAMVGAFESFKESLAEPLAEVRSDIKTMRTEVEATGAVQSQ
ncbi:hypothetical protein [Endozoicomonas arenosclerae]|uniref:hypothetical protein n=1 Tax=Endozoicomonas arenosclerae TaxID=1633495 RepID=UPI000783434F|nr:hypothetical protein [Endozoicomonas arenosclerae]